MDANTALDPADLIAVVGMAGRFPGAPDADSLWALMMARQEAIRPVPTDRWDSTAQLDPELPIPAVGGFLDGVDLFDAGFFGVSPREAAAMDPQQRLLLEVGWRALEDAGQRAADLVGTRTGVYVASVWHDYELLRKARGARHTSHTLVGSGRDILATRLSYFLKLRGPSMAIDTGCSSALVGLDLAARALRQGDIEGALVGSTNLMLDPHVTVGLTHFGGLSPDGRCASFAKSANGFVRGEGVAAVYLKTLRRALEDGDRVHGVLVSTLTNNDGGGQSMVSPSLQGQEDLLRRTYEWGAVPAAALSYVEAHGTGTKRGDPTEAAALGGVIGRARPAGDPLPIGSIKTNVGHLEGSSGMAGLFKVLLALRHRVVPPTLHAEELNPAIPFDELNLSVVREPLPLPAEGPVYLGVNSFGWGGTNAHVIVASPPPVAQRRDTVEPVPATGLPAVVPLSAHRLPVLARRAEELLDALPAKVTDSQIAELAGTLAWHRDHFAERAAAVTGTAAELRTALTALAAGRGTAEETASDIVTGRAARKGGTVFVFPGQGSQWSGMGRELYRDSPLFTSVVDRCAKALAPHTDWDLISVFADAEGAAEGAEEAWMSRTDVLQPVLWAMSLGLAELWRASGVMPDVVLGHSQGEITAATFAGILSYEDAALILARRGSVITRRASGRGLMLAVDLDRRAAEEALEGFEDAVSFAAHNGPDSCVLSGDRDHILTLRELLEAEGTYCRLVTIDYASHSAGMTELRDQLLSVLAPVQPVAGTVPLMSTVDSRIVDGTELDAAYWVRNLCQPIEFVSAMTGLLDDGATHVVEISPHPVLAPALERIAAGRAEPPAVLTTIRRRHGGTRDIARSLARAYTAGLEPFGGLPRNGRFPVPGYPLEPESFWPAEGGRRGTAVSGFEVTLTPAPGRPGDWHGAVELALDELPWLRDHQLYDTAVLPGAGMLALALSTARDRTGVMPRGLADIAFRKEVTLDREAVRLAAEWRDVPGGGGNFRLLSLPAGADAWDVIATARADYRERARTAPAFPDWADADADAGDRTGPRTTGPEEFYRLCTERGQVYGPAFQGLRTLITHPSGTEALGEVLLPERLHVGNRAHAPHPALWDAALQVGLALHDGDDALMPIGVREIHLLHDPREPLTALWSHVVRRDDGTLDVRLFTPDRLPLMVMEGLELRPLPGGDGGRDADEERLHGIRWHDVTGGRATADAAATGNWIVCGSADATAEAVTAALVAAGAEARRLGTGSAEPLGGVTEARGVVFVAPRSSVGLDAQQRGLNSLTAVVRACSGLGVPPRLTVVTDRGQPVDDDETPDPGSALYWGFGRVVQREHGELGPRLIDVDVSEPGWAESCAAEILDDASGEDQMALRDGRRLAARITRGGPAGEPVSPPPAWRTGRQPFRIGAARLGDGRNTAEFLPLARRVPGPGEIEIEVTAAALSTADARRVLDGEPRATDRATTGDAGGGTPLGRECAGRVTAVGPDVTSLQPGDRVVACGPGALASHTVVRADHARRVPDHIGDAEASALSLPLVTAWHALAEAGRLGAEETVLVHAGAGPLGPVGTAAVHVARFLGARIVVAAAGTDDGQPGRESGAHLAVDTQDPAWADAVREATDGRGVDLALSVRGGPDTAPVWDLLAEDGRYVQNVTPAAGGTGAGAGGTEAGRTVVPETIRTGLWFASVDVDALRERRPERFARLLGKVWDLVTSGALETLPVRAYDHTGLTEALREVSRGHRPERPVLTGLGAVEHVAPEPMPGGRFRADGGYLITGGLGALGLSLAEYLADNGAGALVLTGRSAPGPETAARLTALRERGIRVETPRCDVTDRAALRRALDELRAAGLPPLRGVVHAAGVLADATVGTVTPRQIAEVLQPKVAGVRNLDAVTAGEPLDFFVLFSSVAALVGNPGQAAYAAANAYLDVFAEARRRRGLPALSVQWGPFAEIGLAAREGRRGARLEERGLESFPAGEAWAALARMLHRDRPVAGYLPLNLRRWFDAYPGTVALSGWRDLYAALKDDAATSSGSVFRTVLAQADAAERAGLVAAKVRELAAQVLRLDPERVDPEALFESLGLDSLMSLELRNRLEAAFGLRLSPTLLWTYGSLRTLSGALWDQVEPSQSPPLPGTGRADRTDGA
ncbi:type I polyketide synthase [Streptomyces sp. NBC_01803]|uniref:type I polyketide synthase n=1 Tax=Streptomyces sp. NBC_01803 TaxID=2975946 RepID=UPI002DDAC6A8|nr:SDR family NAD(P)-dependent oxidoreductase [Streptomyces sp. NBC_01803]WSA43163.1 SDR family NAD(P)-dependent oxidoreductase [Streptomyces sp. NBC_01803]